ncbi:MAG: glutathione S-transferase family protein [Rhodospirillaceae bacterium]|nr:glutathione S-transferase family protein [Rhodospirillaceae bacterium]MBT5564502.1 glutathione S-transferase family protein [Rhodospirillaceae bacterium]MBT6089792.1 glutathione S-transferase family protein [Rhodospirillaceae bacterium]MBT6582351.1 glutathione S-transferase family protein [Bacteroidetes Order II. bacterium]MBT7451889.1 glutathione S-transferase family protein [Rhodospirillaceae bacterium]
MSDIELFSFEACPFAQRTRMMMIEKGIECSLTEVDLYNKPDWWKELSPHGKVPLIRHNGEIVYESRIINEYLEDVFPEPPLLPADPLRRAMARIWIDYCDTYFLPALHKLIADRQDKEKQKENRTLIAEKLLFIENEGLRKLGDGPYFMGRELTLVDLQYMPFIERFPCYEELWGASIPEECTRFRDWFETMQARESHHKTVNTLEFHMQRYSKYDKAA